MDYLCTSAERERIKYISMFADQSDLYVSKDVFMYNPLLDCQSLR